MDTTGLPAGNATSTNDEASPPPDGTTDHAAPTARHDGAAFDVFLSHNSKDKPAIERLAVKLRQAGLEPWLDRWHLTPGGRWQDEISDGIGRSRACAVFVGPHGLGDWSREETDIAIDQAVKNRAFRTFLVLLPGVPEPFDASILPRSVSMRTWVDLRPGIEDPRAFQQLINAVLGVAQGPAAPLANDADLCPYRGLEAFHEEHADYFFGRDAEIQRLVELLKGSRFTSILGPSGSGKSSLARAGLLPALRRGGLLPGSERWTIQTLRPGPRPLETLAAVVAPLDPSRTDAALLDALRADARTLDLTVRRLLADRTAGDRHVLLIDQFEETFTLCSDEAERRAFLDTLLHAATKPDGRCVVILTMRADFYHRCAAYPELAAPLAAHNFLVSPLTPDGLRSAIVEPAWKVGLEFESGLVETILSDVAERPGALPLLEYALLELWERRRGTMLTLEGYRASGGVQEAIGRRAEAVYDTLSADEQAVARRVLLRLIQPGEGTEDTRRRATLDELRSGDADSETVSRVIQALASERLLTTGREETGDGASTLDLAHEALIRHWKQLRAWIDENRDDLMVHRRLTEAALEWNRLARDDGLLYRGSRLAGAEEWRPAHAAELSDLERAFLDASVGFRDREVREREERERAERERVEREQARELQALFEREKRRRLLTLGLGVGLLVMLGFLVFSGTQWLEAEQQRRIAERRFADVRHLANTFLFDFHDAIANLAGSTPARHLIVESALTYLQRLGQDAGGNLVLLRDTAVGHDRVGDVQKSLGDTDGALASYRAALAIFERLVQTYPTSVQAQRDLSVSHSKVGDVLLDQGDAPAALTAYRASHTIDERLTQADPSNAQAQRDLSISHNRVGDVLLVQGDAAAALAAYRASLAIAERLTQADPSNAQAQRDLSISHNRVGDVLRSEGDTLAALASYRSSLSITERLAAADPSNAQAQRDLSVSHNNVGDVLLAQGDTAGALTAYRASLAISERLAQDDPSNAQALRDLALSYSRTGEIHRAGGDLAAARQSYEKAGSIFERLAELDRTNARAQQDLAYIQARLQEVGATP